jgi:UDP-N-acetylmuramoyl-L-alanyl-D-glutamate--2,6-diaminopimelate ligase
VVEVGHRRAAIAEALGRARAGDIVLVAGKGHETGQEVDGVVHPFDDRVVVREELARMRKNAGSGTLPDDANERDRCERSWSVGDWPC